MRPSAARKLLRKSDGPVHDQRSLVVWSGDIMEECSVAREWAMAKRLVLPALWLGQEREGLLDELNFVGAKQPAAPVMSTERDDTQHRCSPGHLVRPRSARGFREICRVIGLTLLAIIRRLCTRALPDSAGPRPRCPSPDVTDDSNANVGSCDSNESRTASTLIFQLPARRRGPSPPACSVPSVKDIKG
jgi:hypothetical protein